MSNNPYLRLDVNYLITYHQKYIPCPCEKHACYMYKPCYINYIKHIPNNTLLSVKVESIDI